VVDKKEKQEQIISAAIREFTKNGFAATTISDIARAAGIGKGTVYEYFSTKEEIIEHTFNFFVRSLEMDFEAILISGLAPVDKLKRIFDSFTRFIDSESQEMLELMFDFWSVSIRHKESKGIIFQEMKKFYQAYREIFSDIIIEGMGDGSIRKDINPLSAASMIVGALDGIMVQWVLDRESFDFKDVVKTMASSFLNGIATEKQ
jgi:AcrR family transcriptional regulator